MKTLIDFHGFGTRYSLGFIQIIAVIRKQFTVLYEL
jgi:hypothetical protein